MRHSNVSSAPSVTKAKAPRRIQRSRGGSSADGDGRSTSVGERSQKPRRCVRAGHHDPLRWALGGERASGIIAQATRSAAGSDCSAGAEPHLSRHRVDPVQIEVRHLAGPGG